MISWVNLGEPCGYYTAASVLPKESKITVKPSGKHLNFSFSSRGDRMALKMIVTQAVEAISRILPRVKATKIVKKLLPLMFQIIQ